jgi:hypothetical protein
MPLCAYCKLERPVTREHVIPAFMYAFQKEAGESVIGWNEVVERMVGGEAKVKDVCARCNNEVLGELDGYAKTLLVNSGLLVRNYVKRDVTLRYEYAPLLRWLLKVSFNSSRTDGAHSHLFEEHIPFILGEAPVPARWRVATLAYLAGPEYLDQSRIKSEPFRTIAQGSNVLNPFLVRICYGGIPGESIYTLRLNIFGPIVFYMLIFNVGTLPGHAASAVRRFLKLTPGARELTSKGSLVELHAGPQTWLDLYAPQVQRARAIASGA